METVPLTDNNLKGVDIQAQKKEKNIRSCWEMFSFPFSSPYMKLFFSILFLLFPWEIRSFSISHEKCNTDFELKGIKI